MPICSHSMRATKTPRHKRTSGGAATVNLRSERLREVTAALPRIGRSEAAILKRLAADQGVSQRAILEALLQQAG